MALRILNQNNLSLVKTVSNRTVPLCRRFRGCCMSTSQAVGSSTGKAEDPVTSEDVAELQRRLMIRPLTRRFADELQPKNLPAYGQQQQWSMEEHLRSKHGEMDYIAVLANRSAGFNFSGRRRNNLDSSIFQNPGGSRAYSTRAPRLHMLNFHPERPLMLSVPPTLNAIQERSFTEDALKLISTYKTPEASKNNGCVWNRSSHILDNTPGVQVNQAREAHKSHRKKTTKRILEEWNKRSSQDYLRIDNILYKYKRKELAKKGLLIEDCPKDKKKQRSGRQDQHKKHPHKGRRKNKKHKKKPGCKNKKLRVKCASLEENTEKGIEAALDELVGTPAPAPTVPAVMPTLLPSAKHYESSKNPLTRNEALNYICGKTSKNNKALDHLLSNVPAAFNPQGSHLSNEQLRGFSTRPLPKTNASLEQINEAYSDEADMGYELEEAAVRADDFCDELETIKPLPAFKAMKLPAEAMLPPPSLAEAEPLPRLRKREAVFDELS